MPRRRWEAAIPLALSIAAYGLAFAQRTGLAVADTKINIQVDPGRYLADVASMWTSSGQLGDVQAGQQAGYLFPMGPFFAAGHALGLPAWIVQRLWLGTLLALAAWGVVRLLDALLGRPRGIAQLIAGVVVMLNPFVVTYANRTTVTLLAYAALPWLLLAVHRGVREPRGWRWPAAFALLVTASGAGINAAVTAWVLLGPALLLVYELAFTEVRFAGARPWLTRTLVLTVLASVWWIVPTYIHSSYGIDFLRFTEQPGTIWSTTSATESLRLMGFWLSYAGIGFSGTPIPYFDDAHTLLFSTPVVLATLLLPAVALTGFIWTRRWRYGPFFLGLALVTVLVMMAGYPDGTLLRHGLSFTYNRVNALRFLRTSYKAAPLLALALACLFGTAAGEGWRRLSARRRPQWLRRRAALYAAAGSGVIAAVAVPALAAWPLVTGVAQDAQVSFKAIPAAWRAAASDLDRQLPANSRAVVLPGDLFSFYRWGGTVDPILPVLSRRPIAERTEVPYADLRATDLLWTIDGLVHQQRLLPGQLAPLLDLVGARAAVTGTDDDLARSAAPAPADVAAALATQRGFATPARTYGSVRTFAPTSGGGAVALPEVRRYDLPSARGLVRVEPVAAPIVVDGSADGIAGLAAFGGLPSRRALLSAGDLSAAGLRAALAQGGELVVSDSNRRRAFVSGSLDQNVGPTLPADQSVSADGLVLDPFARGPNFETVATFVGVRSVHAPASPQITQFPEHAPFAAIDGSPQTAWLADPTLDAGRRWLEVDFDHPRDVPYVDLLPYDDAGGAVTEVQIAGHMFAVHRGWNHLELGLRGVASLRVLLTGVSAPAPGAVPGAGGISELRIPGVRAGEELRLPVDAARALDGSALRLATLAYVFQRTTGDDPFRRGLAHGPYSARDVRDPGDAERTMRRRFELPASRSFSATAWVTVAAQTADDTVDRLAGYRGPVDATSSGRFDGQAGWRASQALDGDPGTSWIGDYRGPGTAWLQWHTKRPVIVSKLRLVAPALRVRRPSQVRVQWPGGSTPPMAVNPGGFVVMPHAVRSRTFRVVVLSAGAPAGASAAQREAVGIAELTGIAGLPRISVPGTPEFAAQCGSVRLRLGTAMMSLRVAGTAAAFEHGAPLAARSCGSPLALGAGTQHLVVDPGPFAVDELRLSSPAPRPLAEIASVGAQVLNSGTSGRGSYDHIRLAVTRPSWLVLGEGYNRGWRAWCNGRSLGAPIPIDGYANGWRIGPGCQDARFAFAPNRLAAVGYVVSGVTGAACLLLLLGGAWRRRRRSGAPAVASTAGGWVDDGRDHAAPWPALSALPVALVAGAAFGFVFGLRAGAACVVVLALVLWRGIGARAMTLIAGLLLGVVVPVMYLAEAGDDRAGNNSAYVIDHVAAHWVGVAAIGLLMLALWRTLRRRSA